MRAAAPPTAARALTALAAIATIGAACGSSDTTSSESTSAAAPAETEPTRRTEPADGTEPPGSADGRTDDTVVVTHDSSPTTACPTDGDEWETAKLYIEHNATDEDTGVHGFFGGEAWSVLCIWDPNGTDMLVADPLENFDRLTVSDLFFESREPPNDEYPVEQAFADFPEGDYTVAGIDFNGVARVGSAVFTHDVPAEPTISSPPLADDAETAGDATVSPDDLVVTWDPVVATIAGAPVEITGYQVIVTDEEADDPNGWARPVYDVHVPADQTSLSVPADWLRPATLYELEVLAIERSGNQTISVGFFTTE